MSTLENCLISTYLLRFSTWVQMEKNWEDTPSATLKFYSYRIWHIAAIINSFSFYSSLKLNKHHFHLKSKYDKNIEMYRAMIYTDLNTDIPVNNFVIHFVLQLNLSDLTCSEREVVSEKTGCQITQ